jgi:hypothetical protein
MYAPTAAVTTAWTSDVVQFRKSLNMKVTDTPSPLLKVLLKYAMLVIARRTYYGQLMVLSSMVEHLYAMNANLRWILIVQHSRSKLSVRMTHISSHLLIRSKMILKNIIV